MQKMNDVLNGQRPISADSCIICNMKLSISIQQFTPNQRIDQHRVVFQLLPQQDCGLGSGTGLFYRASITPTDTV